MLKNQTKINSLNKLYANGLENKHFFRTILEQNFLTISKFRGLQLIIYIFEKEG